MQETGGIISHNLSFSPPAITNTLPSGFPVEHRFPISIFILCRNFRKHKMEIFGLVFPSVGFVEVNMVSMICSD